MNAGRRFAAIPAVDVAGFTPDVGVGPSVKRAVLRSRATSSNVEYGRKAVRSGGISQGARGVDSGNSPRVAHTLRSGASVRFA
jgi:hypothetical protein